MTKERILKAARRLDRNDRLKLVDTLIASVDLTEMRKLDNSRAGKIGERIAAIMRRKAKLILAD